MIRLFGYQVCIDKEPFMFSIHYNTRKNIKIGKYAFYIVKCR
jgi:hypothetical protein